MCCLVPVSRQIDHFSPHAPIVANDSERFFHLQRQRRILVDVQLTWAIGSLFVGVAAWTVLSFGHSWRLLALVAAVPPFAVLCCFRFIPESPRWLIANGR